MYTRRSLRIWWVGTLLLLLLGGLPRVASALPPEQLAAIQACEAGNQGLPDQFKEIKRYSTGGWAAIFNLEKKVPMFCGQNVAGASNHGYLHIRDRHQGDWENIRTRMVSIVGNHPALSTWMDVVDPAIKAALVSPSQVTTELTECRAGVLYAINSAGSSYTRGYKLVVQRTGSGVYPEDAIGTLFPSGTDCNGNAIPTTSQRSDSGSAAAAAAALPRTEVRCQTSACTYTIGANNIFVKPGSGASYFLGGPTKQKWEATRASLPNPTTDANCRPIRSGCLNKFNGSSIYYTASTGAQIMAGRIRDKFGQLGSEGSFLGYPTTSEKCGLVRSGCFNHFEGDASIHYSPATGAFSTRGKIRSAWISDGSERGHFGYPVTDEYHPDGRPDSHRISEFEYGFLYYDGQAVTGEWTDPGCPTCRHVSTYPDL